MSPTRQLPALPGEEGAGRRDGRWREARRAEQSRKGETKPSPTPPPTGHGENSIFPARSPQVVMRNSGTGPPCDHENCAPFLPRDLPRLGPLCPRLTVMFVSDGRWEGGDGGADGRKAGGGGEARGAAWELNKSS